MSFFDTLKQSLTGKPLTIIKPIFIKEDSDAKEELEKLERLKTIASEETAKQIEQDIKMLCYGIKGEENVVYELKNSYMPILVLRDLYLEYNGLTAQIDFVVIDTKFILIIECKNMIGDIEITNTGDFIRNFKSSSGKIYKKEGIYSPIVQNERHVELIKTLLCENMKSLNSKKCEDVLKSIVVLANHKTILNAKYAKRDVKNRIIKLDQLISHMKNLHNQNKDGTWFPEEGMYHVAEILINNHKQKQIDYTKKYNLNSTIETVRPQSNICKEEKLTVSDMNRSIQATDTVIEETPIYIDLKQYRYNKSKIEGVKPYFIYNNNQMVEIIQTMPRSLEEIKTIHGFAEVKCQKYGSDILAIIQKYINK